MKFDQQALIDTYKRETGVSAVQELKFNAWLVKKVTVDSASIVTIVKELDNLTADQYYYWQEGRSTTSRLMRPMDWI
ncbi:hypothetical protein [Methanothermobacter thermautotrophicus]|uniref:hypothetical protein n=1 Tax=Methanothermobacter thermautotrophicus TaxID=145262 RepID=UPI001D00AF8E|nr:hypothetical protein [Methanothermobacter thermautotrophicus]